MSIKSRLNRSACNTDSSVLSFKDPYIKKGTNTVVFPIEIEADCDIAIRFAR
jgi:hypothetical protein